MRRNNLRNAMAAFGLATPAALGLAADAQNTVTVTGHYDNSAFYGYGPNASNTVYVIPADTPAGPSATFNNNKYLGFYAPDASDSVTVNGGQFNGNGLDGFRTEGATVTVNGGLFSGNGAGLVSYYSGTTLTAYGGQFSGNQYDFVSAYSGRLDIYGAFAGLSVGQMQDLSKSVGSFTGTLQNNNSPQTFTYSATSGTLILHDVTAAPEPSACAGFALGALGLGGLALRTRRKAGA